MRTRNLLLNLRPRNLFLNMRPRNLFLKSEATLGLVTCCQNLHGSQQTSISAIEVGDEGSHYFTAAVDGAFFFSSSLLLPSLELSGPKVYGPQIRAATSLPP